ncbi:MAG: dienelactone hydrolase family protein [Oligoflexales bacterium]
MTKEVVIESEDVVIKGIMSIPASARGIVLFAHGSGSGRLSPRNQFVAGVLQDGQVATLLLDLLQESEEGDRSKVFDIYLLAKRLLIATDWLSAQGHAELKIGYFGASTGAAAALLAAANRPTDICAVVSRGGRPDLAGPWLSKVEAPTLLIVGGLDKGVIELNQDAYAELVCEKRMDIVPGATHLFEEAGTLEQAAHLARAWFQKKFEKAVLGSEAEHPHAQREERRASPTREDNSSL